jgi:hypothetical protein
MTSRRTELSLSASSGEELHGPGFAAVVADDSGEKRCCRRGRLAVVGVGDGVEDSVADVEVATAGHCDVQVVAGGAFVEQRSGTVEGAALYAGDRRSVGELDVHRDVGGWQEHTVPPAFVDDGERAVAVPFGDMPDGPVDDVAVSLGAQLPVVVSGHDPVADSGASAVTEADAVGLDITGGDAQRSGRGREVGDGVVVASDDHRVASGELVLPPVRHDRGDHVVAAAAADAAVVFVDGRDASVPYP